MVKLRIDGKIYKREETTNNITEYNETRVRIVEKYSNPVEFNKDLRSSPHKMIDKLPPKNVYSINKEEYRMTVDFNASEAIEWAEKVAEYREDDTVIDILSYWLQLFNTKRLRRALHCVLKEKHGIETNVNL